MTYDVVKMGDNTYQTSVVASQLVVMSHRSSYSIPSSRFTMVDTRPKPGIQRAGMLFQIAVIADAWRSDAYYVHSVCAKLRLNAVWTGEMIETDDYHRGFRLSEDGPDSRDPVLISYDNY